ncbi:MAG: DUF5058 family protein [Oscillospiraceae bacterium]|jgi:hypothetical protein|nr:DUF5058 family protein [Oscillospiraceae bacterium]
MPNFKDTPFMYLVGGLVAAFVVTQSVFFAAKAWRRARKLGIEQAQLKRTVAQSVLFTLAPALTILATILVLGSALGLPLPWLRLTVIGNINYEVTAAESALQAFGQTAGVGEPVTDPAMFSAAAWVMTIGSCFPLILCPLFVKKIQQKVGKTVNTNARWADIMSNAAVIGIIAAFVARAIAGMGKAADPGDGAGLMSVTTLLVSVLLTVPLQKLAKAPKMGWLEPFVLPIALFAALGVAVLLGQLLPPELVQLEWRQ